MGTDRWAQVEQLCHEALELGEDQQAEFLDSACGADQELRREVESLLVHRQRAETFIEAPAMQMAALALAAEQDSSTRETSRQIGRVFSNYRLVEKVASGGMGDIYRAVRADGTYDKQVAIKLIQGARSTDFFLSRFQNERQILADLDHANIARLLDGGTTEEGLPYVVMEYIQGVPIDEFCEQKGLAVRERLELFRTVCSAVHYAHQNLVVHRDLKPGNILVTAEGVPKLLDFGIAKILNPQRGEEFPQQTITVMRLLTPHYASPEQLRNEPISTATDIYSLGVILYELLAGRSPYGVAPEDSLQGLMRAICEAEPEKPSTSAMGKHAPDGEDQEQPSSSSPKQTEEKRSKLRRVLSGDLDNIVLKALRKEPQRRYSSVEQFSEDIRRYLAGLPVVAHEDSLAYRSRKFVSRHKLGAAAAVLLVLSLSGGLVATLWQARIARSERARAERRFNDVRSLANSLIFDVHDSIKDLAGSTTARKIIVDRALQYLNSLAGESRGDLSLQRELANAYDRVGDLQYSDDFSNQGDLNGALQSYRKALAIRELLAAANPNDTQVQIELADEHIKLVDPIEATGDFRGALDNLRKIPPILEKSVAKSSDAKLLDRQAGSYYFIGRMLNQMNEPASALESYRKATAIHESEKSGDPRVASLIKTHLAGDYAGMAESLMYTNNLSEASKAQEHAVQILEDLSRSEPNSAPLRHYLGNSYDLLATIAEKKGEQVRALDFRQRAHELSKQMRISDPSDVLAKYNFAFSDESLGESLIATGHVPEGVARIREALVVFQAAAREGSKDRYVSSGLADCYFGLGMASMSLAIREGGGPVQKKKSLSDALSWFLKSAEVWSEKRKQGALDGGERETADRVDQGIAKCNTALAKLSNIQIPGKH